MSLDEALWTSDTVVVIFSRHTFMKIGSSCHRRTHDQIKVREESAIRDKPLNIRTSPPNSCLPHTADLAKPSPSTL